MSINRLGVCILFTFIFYFGAEQTETRKVGFVLGVWDLYHEGHRTFLTNAANRCDELIIGVHTSEFAEGQNNILPFMDTQNRENVMATAASLLNRPTKVIRIDSHKEAFTQNPAITTLFHGDNWEENKYR